MKACSTRRGFTYQWQRANDDIISAIMKIYTISSTYADGERCDEVDGQGGSTTSTATVTTTPTCLRLSGSTDPVVYNQPRPFIIVGDLVDGRLTTGVQLTADTSGMVDDGFHYQTTTPTSGNGTMW